MENITIINLSLQILVSILLIYFVIKHSKLEIKYNKELEENEKNKNVLFHVENAVYNIKDLKGKNRPKLFFNQTLDDIVNLREIANKYEGIKPEYDNLVKEYPKLEELYENNQILLNETKVGYYDIFGKIAKELGISFNKWKVIIENDFIVKIKSMFLAISNLEKDLEQLRKSKDIAINANTYKIQELEKRNHAKDQQICDLRKQKGIKAPKRNNRKTGQTKNNK